MMNEYISRDKVLKKFIEGDGHDDDRFTEGYNFAVQEHREEVENIPAADVQRIRRGHWIEEEREVGGCFKLYQKYIHCSECGNEHYSGTLPKPKFCDECGADMRNSNKTLPERSE